jgi:hypothetical protein
MDKSDWIGIAALWLFVALFAFFADEPTGCTNVWNSMQHKAMGKECPK